MKYGSLGYILGHEIIHAFDYESLTQISRNKEYNLSSGSLKELNDKTNCFRQQFEISPDIFNRFSNGTKVSFTENCIFLSRLMLHAF